MTIRAKVMCVAENKRRTNYSTEPARVYDFQTVYDPASPEDERFCKATPSGSATFTVENPAVEFEPGKSYYVDFTPAD